MTVPINPIEDSEAPNPTKMRRMPTASQASRKGIATPRSDGDALKDFGEHFIGVASPQARLGGEDEAVGKDVRSHGLDVIGKDVVTAGDGGERTSGSEQCKAAARAGAEFEGRVFARGLDDADGVAADGGFDVQVPEGVCQARQLLAGDDRLEGIHRVLAFEAAQDLVLLVLAGVPELEADEETVQLGLGKRKGPFEFDRVLRRDDEERAREHGGDSLNGELVLFHGFEERRLGAWGGAVDLIGEHDLGDEWAFAKYELAQLLVVVVDAGDVGRHEVRRELDAFERAAEGPGDGLGEGGLPQARDVFEQDVAFAEKGNEGEPDDIGLANDHSFDARLESFSRGFDEGDVFDGEAVGDCHRRMVPVGSRTARARVNGAASVHSPR